MIGRNHQNGNVRRIMNLWKLKRVCLRSAESDNRFPRNPFTIQNWPNRSGFSVETLVGRTLAAAMRECGDSGCIGDRGLAHGLHRNAVEMWVHWNDRFEHHIFVGLSTGTFMCSNSWKWIDTNDGATVRPMNCVLYSSTRLILRWMKRDVWMRERSLFGFYYNNNRFDTDMWLIFMWLLCLWRPNQTTLKIEIELIEIIWTVRINKFLNQSQANGFHSFSALSLSLPSDELLPNSEFPCSYFAHCTPVARTSTEQSHAISEIPMKVFIRRARKCLIDSMMGWIVARVQRQLVNFKENTFHTTKSAFRFSVIIAPFSLGAACANTAPFRSIIFRVFVLVFVRLQRQS